MQSHKPLFIALTLLTALAACQTEPDSHPFAPTITVYSEKPEAAPAEASKPNDRASATTVPGTSMPGMVYVPGGFTQIGADDGQDWEKPVFWIAVKPFLFDEHPVTVAEFRKFVQATNYKTEAEKFGDGGILDENAKQWTLQKGADWAYPRGKAFPKAPDNHPVTQVSWNDAQAYAKWAGKRLPYEFEWEHAARNARNSRTQYPFGNDIKTAGGKYLANTWNGTFPEKDAVADGFHHTSPVGYYGKTPLGLTDMTGNVWEWCEDWRQNYVDVMAGKLPVNPTEKVQRGGSFMCEPGWCHGYRVSGRSFTSPETSLMHVGFRCAKDINRN